MGGRRGRRRGGTRGSGGGWPATRLGSGVFLLCLMACSSSPAEGEPEGLWNSVGLESVAEWAEENRSSAILIVHRGEVVLERYWTVDPSALPLGQRLLYASLRYGVNDRGEPVEDVASVQKGVVALLAAMAAERGHLALDDPVAQHLGASWSGAAPAVEGVITVGHLLAMTSGLDEDLEFDAPAGEQWSYNSPAYHILHQVLEAATGIAPQSLLDSWLGGPLGLEDATWVTRGAGPLGLATTARDLARIGELVRLNGAWQGTSLVGSSFVASLLVPGQSDNPSYGLLWWLNGKAWALHPGGERHEGSLYPAAPSDLVMALGAFDRHLAVSRDAELVLVRLGAYADGPGNPGVFDELWRRVMAARTAGDP